MAGILDDRTLDVPCRHCGHRMAESIRRLRSGPELTCPKCGTITKCEAPRFRTELSDADKARDDLRRILSAFGKS